jgi:hypothetical protein
MATVGTAALFVTLATHVHAQAPPPRPCGPLAAESESLTDARIAIVQDALQLTPEQQKCWPPIEQAIPASEQNTDEAHQKARPRDWTSYAALLLWNSCATADLSPI